MKMVKNIVVLTLITVVSGFLLGYVYDLTKEPIALADAQAKQDAYKAVFPEADKFYEVPDFDPNDAISVLAAHGYDNESVDEVLSARDAGDNEIGYVMVVSTGQGYGGLVTLSMGISNDGLIKGIEFLSISETPGLGMNATKDDFKLQFKNMPAGQISYTKTGKSAEYEIDAISGATITTNAVTSAVNAGLSYYNNWGYNKMSEVSNEQ